MSDIEYFACLGITILSGVIAVVAAHSIIKEKGSCGWSTALAVSCCIGFISALPWGKTQEMPWLPLVAGAFFTAVALSTVLCCLCKIKEWVDKSSKGEP
jgi:hypothetical protein